MVIANDNLHLKQCVLFVNTKVLLNFKIEMYLKFVMQNVLVSYPGTISLKVKGDYVLKILSDFS